MTRTFMTLTALCKEALSESHRIVHEYATTPVREVHHERVTDISTEGDVRVSEKLIDFFQKQCESAILYSEESGRLVWGDGPQHTIAIDDIDGTMNFYRGRRFLPHSTIITLFDSPTPTYRDALFAGVLDHISGTLWHAVRGEGCYENERRVRTSGQQVLTKKTFVIADGTANIKEMFPLYQRAWVRDYGSAAFHIAGLSSGMFDAYVHAHHKSHELGAAYLFLKEAEGYLATLEGEPFDDKLYVFDEVHAILAAATPELAHEIRALVSMS